jgi:hypothetical protein
MWKALVFLPLCAGCATLTWQRESRNRPVPAEAVARLEAGKTELGECLALFGAPLWVWEDVEHGRPAAALAYGWFDARDFGFSVSFPLTDYYSASYNFDRIDQRMQGLVLFFDEHWRLLSWRTGLLHDLTHEERRPPAFVEDGA